MNITVEFRCQLLITWIELKNQLNCLPKKQSIWWVLLFCITAAIMLTKKTPKKPLAHLRVPLGALLWHFNHTLKLWIIKRKIKLEDKPTAVKLIVWCDDKTAVRVKMLLMAVYLDGAPGGLNNGFKTYIHCVFSHNFKHCHIFSQKDP